MHVQPTLDSLAWAQLQFQLTPGAGWGDNARVRPRNQTTSQIAGSFGSNTREFARFSQSPSHGRQSWSPKAPWAQCWMLSPMQRGGKVAARDAESPSRVPLLSESICPMEMALSHPLAQHPLAVWMLAHGPMRWLHLPYPSHMLWSDKSPRVCTGDVV